MEWPYFLSYSGVIELRMHFERFHDNDNEKGKPMKKIILLCNSGMSTSLMVQKMKDAAAAEGLECAIAAYSTDKAAEVASDADCILLGPQIQFQADEVRAACPGVPVAVIDMVAYGTMDATLRLPRPNPLWVRTRRRVAHGIHERYHCQDFFLG